MADLTPTAAMAEAAARGLRLHDEGKSGDGLKPETVRRANIIARRDELTESHVREMRAWFARHESDKRPGWDDAGEETPGFVAWLLWGGDPAESWSNRKVAEMDREQEGRSVERRGLTSPVELREENGQPRLFGYAALYESESVVLPGGFREVLRRGAFDDALASPETDVVALFNHDSNLILGRQSAGTLRLSTDERGLRYDITPPDTQVGRDTVELVRVGNVSGASFAFTVRPDDEEYKRTEDGPRRFIDRVAGLYDVSVVLTPAYPETTAAVRQRAAELLVEPIAEQVEQLPLRVSPLAQAEHVARWLRRVV